MKEFAEDEKDSRMNIGRKNLTIIKLRNGLPMDISKKPNVDFDLVNSQNDLHPTIRNRAFKHLHEVQSYYDFIKDKMKKKP